jgi:ribosomal protein S13
LEKADISIDAKIKDLSEDELNKIRSILDEQGDIEGDLQKARSDGHQAFDGHRLLSRTASSPQFAGSRTANQLPTPEREKVRAKRRLRRRRHQARSSYQFGSGQNLRFSPPTT